MSYFEQTCIKMLTLKVSVCVYCKYCIPFYNCFRLVMLQGVEVLCFLIMAFVSFSQTHISVK